MNKKTKKQKKIRKLLFLALIVVAGAFWSVFFASDATAAAFDYKLLESFPGFFSKNQSAPTLEALVLALYKFGIWTIGIAGLLMITIGGFMYAASAGNTSQIDTAKGIIKDALIGIVAAMVAYLFLFIINPDLVKINLNLTKVSVAKPPTTPAAPMGGVCTGTSAGCCKADTRCTDCSGCTDFSNSYPSLCYKGAAGSTGCKLNASLASKLVSANLSSVGAEVSEAWPPTVDHSSSCHTNGTCADVRCKVQCDNVKDISDLKKIYDALKNAGLSPLYETKKSCAPYKAAGMTNCGSYPTMTSPSSFHVNM